jgi:hypothetical protein
MFAGNIRLFVAKGDRITVKTRLFMAVAALISASVVSADQFEVIQRLQGAEEIAYRDAAYAVLLSAGVLPGSARPDAALNAELRERLGWADRPTDDAVSVSEFSFLVMEGFDIPGGLMYRLAPGPRYALRELRFRRILTEPLNGPSSIEGAHALRMLANAMDWQRRRQEEDAP